VVICFLSRGGQGKQFMFIICQGYIIGWFIRKSCTPEANNILIESVKKNEGKNDLIYSMLMTN